MSKKADTCTRHRCRPAATRQQQMTANCSSCRSSPTSDVWTGLIQNRAPPSPLCLRCKTAAEQRRQQTGAGSRRTGGEQGRERPHGARTGAGAPTRRAEGRRGQAAHGRRADRRHAGDAEGRRAEKMDAATGGEQGAATGSGKGRDGRPGGGAATGGGRQQRRADGGNDGLRRPQGRRPAEEDERRRRVESPPRRADDGQRTDGGGKSGSRL